VRNVCWPGSSVASVVESSDDVTFEAEAGSCARFWHEASSPTKPSVRTVMKSALLLGRERMMTVPPPVGECRRGRADPHLLVH
jgi:hypothetical protein